MYYYYIYQYGARNPETQRLNELMPFSERKLMITRMLSAGKPVSVKELSDCLNVSSMTIRRDLDLLESEGRLRRSHGWAEPVRTEQYEPSYLLRMKENSACKKAICKAAAPLVKDGDVLFLDVGTTLLYLPEMLKDKKEITILTHWLPQALEAAKFTNLRTVVLGGTLRSSELSLTGMISENTLREFNADKCFLSIGGVSPDKGVTDYNIEEVEIKKSALQASKYRIIAADYSKLGIVAPIKVAMLKDIDLLITDSKSNTSQLEAFRRTGVDLVIAE